jgi:PleD family two-component response regulator
MLADLEPRRVLLAADPCLTSSLQKLFGTGVLHGWEARGAESLNQARTVLQEQPSDVLVLDESVYRRTDTKGRAWLERQEETAVLLVARAQAALVAHALEHGVNHWLPRFLVQHNPLVLAAALEQTARLTDLRRRMREVGTAFQESRRQVDRLAGLLWRTLPGDGPPRWLTQRLMMERFQDELSRAERYGGPLTVVLGEVDTFPGNKTELLSPWVAERLSQAKRRCDVAGQYGPRGFMLLLTHTAEAGGVACCRRLQHVLRANAGRKDGLPKGGQAFFGIAAFSRAAATLPRLLSLAERNLAAARAAGMEMLAI